MRRNIKYALLSDEGSKIIRSFGIFDDRYRPRSYAYGVPHPMIFVVDPDRVIRHRFSKFDYYTRTDIDVVLRTLKKSKLTRDLIERPVPSQDTKLGTTLAAKGP